LIINDAGLAIIKHFEGLRTKPYKDAVGLATVGYGHRLYGDIDWERIYSDAECTDFLKDDLRATEKSVARLINVPLNDNQFSALVSFTFNVGSGTLQRSTLRQVINRGRYDEAPKEINRYRYAGGRILRGLQLRRYAEANLFVL